MKAILSIDPIRYPLTGIGRYTLELARHLKLQEDVETLRFFAGISFKEELPGLEHVETPGIASRIRPLKAAIARNDLALRAHQWLSQERRAKALRGFEDHVFHGTNFYLPRFDGPSVATFHDLSVFKFPQFHPPERVRHMGREVALSVKRASVLITDSNAVKGEICEHFGWPEDRVRVAPLAAGAQFRPMVAVETQDVLNRFGVSYRGYGLFVGTMEPRKNIERLLLAYEAMRPDLRKNYPLLLIGDRGWRNDAIMQRVSRAVEQGWAKYVGFAADADLPSLFAGARAFLFPSIYEGFGLPVLEALACGVPVVTSNRSSLPEVAGDAALLCDPEDVDGLATAFERALEDENWRRSAQIAGPRQAAGFSWELCAKSTVDAYRLAAASRR